MWHIFFTHNALPPQYTLFLNSKADTGLLALNHHDPGLHDTKEATVRGDEKLLIQWLLKYTEFPEDPPKYGYDGKLESVTFKDIFSINVTLSKVSDVVL